MVVQNEPIFGVLKDDLKAKVGQDSTEDESQK